MIKPLRYCLFLLLVISIDLLSNESNAQSTTDPVFLNIKVKDGLPSNEVFKINQDSLGLMWFATNDGFVRFDGYQMNSFGNSSPSIALTNNQITDIQIGENHDLWISNYEGLIRFHGKNGASEAINLGGIREIRCLLNQGDSIIWAGTADGLFKISTRDYEYQHLTVKNSRLGSNIVRALHLDEKNVLWIGTFNGLNALRPDGKMEYFDLKGSYKPELKNNLILDIEAYPDKTNSKLWIGSETGLVLFDKQSGKHTTYNASNTDIQSEVIKCIHTNNTNEVYLGTDFGFYYFNLNTGQIQQAFHNPFNNYSIANNVIWDIFEDRSGILWLATSNGISKLNFDQSMFHFTPVYSREESGIIGTQVNDLYFSRDKSIWLATKKGVIVQYPDGKQRKFSASQNSKNRLFFDNINTISGDHLGRIWIGSTGGINIWDPHTETMHTITASFELEKGLRSNYIGAFIAPSDGSFWVTTWGGGMYKATGNFENIDDISFKYVANFNTNLYTTHKKLWVSDENKIYSIDLNTEAIEHVDKINNILNGKGISSIQITSKGILWIGSRNEILAYNTNNHTVQNFRIYAGTDSNVLNLTEDHAGNIWGTTLTAIFKLSANNYQLETFPKKTGIPLDNFLWESKAIADNGSIFFGGNDGYISFSPSEISNSNYQPEIILSSFSVNNHTIHSLADLSNLNKSDQLITYSEKLVLKYDQHSFSINFASLDFGEPERNIYAYQLEGYDEEWIYTSGQKNFASYSNLSSGKYVFKVKGTNNDGVWSENIKTLSIVIKPPVWASPLAIVIYIVILQVLLVSLFLTYRNKIRWKEEIRSITVEKEKNEEIARLKQQFFTNVSHEFRTPLSLIMGPSQSLKESLNLSKHDNKLLELINKNAQRLYSLVNQLLDLRKIELNTLQLKMERVDVVSLCKKQFSLFEDMAESKNIEYLFHSDYKELIIDIDIAKLESILQNLLSNAFKFTNENGRVVIKVTIQNNEFVQITVSDSGCGIDEEIQSKIFDRFYQNNSMFESTGYGIGLNIAKEYCDLMKGKIHFTSDKNKGTTFFVEIPVKQTLELEKGVVNIEKSFESDAKQTAIVNTALPLILIVDDHPDTLNFLRIKFQEKYNIVTAHNGKEALEQLKKSDIKLIISDIMMPVLDGIEFCEKVKSHPKHEHIPLILLTARTLDNQKIEAYKAGSDAFMTKPFEVDVLMARIDGLLEKSKKIDQFIKKQLIVENQDVDVLSSDEKLLKETVQYINQHLSDPEINLDEMCRKLGISHSSLYRKVKAQTGTTLNELVRKTRLKKAAQLIQSKKLTIAEVMAETGFTNHSYFAKCFKKEFKVAPREFNR